MGAATKLASNVSLFSDSEMLGIEGVLLDETFPVVNREPLGLYGIARILNFKDAFARKMMVQRYPIREDPEIAFARCLILDNRTANTQTRLGRKLSKEVILNRWDEWYNNSMSVAVADELASNSPSTAPWNEIKDIVYTNAILTTSFKHAYIITKAGYIGLGPLHAATGDTIAIFNGASAPCVLRKVMHKDAINATHSIVDIEDVDKWEIIGNCYIQDFMENEVASPEWQEKKEVFLIV